MYLLVTRGYGWSVNDIIWSCPADLEPYVRSHRYELTERDYIKWQEYGSYGINALVFAIEHCLAGRKARTEYMKEPIYEGPFKDEVKQQRIDNERIKLMGMLQTMQVNFNLAKEEEKKKTG